MKKLLVLLMTILLPLAATATPGNDHGNGGGMICVNNHCQTLADSGLVISPEYPDFWIPSEAVLRELNSLISRYPFTESIRGKLRERILLKMTHFKAVDVVDPAKLEMIKQFYIDTIKATSPNFDFTNFKIVALSSDNSADEKNTFLLPDFLKLGAVEQAKLLIHEGLYRGRPSADLKYILQLESALKIFESPSEYTDIIRRNMVTAQISAYHLNILTSSEALAHLVLSTYTDVSSGYKEYNTQLSGKVFEEIFKISVNATYVMNVDSEYVQKNSSLDARTAVMLLNLNADIKLKNYTYGGSSSYLLCDNVDGFQYFSYYKSKMFTILEPENLKLLLPK